MKRLHLYIGAGKEIPIIEYSDVKFRILDETGKTIQVTPVEADKTYFLRIREQQCGIYYLHLEPGQKIGSVKIMWKQSEQTFPMSEAKKVESTIQS